VTVYSDSVVKAYKVKVFLEQDDGTNVPIGRATNFTANLANDLEAIPELGSVRPVEIIEGMEKVTGSITEMSISLDVIKTYAMRSESGSLPYMRFIGTVPTSTGIKTITVSGAKLNGFAFNADVKNKALNNTYAFTAIRVEVT